MKMVYHKAYKKHKKPSIDIITIIFFLSLIALVLIIPILINQEERARVGKAYNSLNKEEYNECYYKIDNNQCVCLDITNSRYKIYYSNNQVACEFSCRNLYSCSSIQPNLGGWVTNENGRIIEVILS